MAVGRVESVDADTGVLTVLASETEIELGDGIGAG
jgi:hypothetical protein